MESFASCFATFGKIFSVKGFLPAEILSDIVLFHSGESLNLIYYKSRVVGQLSLVFAWELGNGYILLVVEVKCTSNFGIYLIVNSCS